MTLIFARLVPKSTPEELDAAAASAQKAFATWSETPVSVREKWEMGGAVFDFVGMLV